MDEPFSSEDAEYLELPGRWADKARALLDEHIETRYVVCTTLDLREGFNSISKTN